VYSGKGTLTVWGGKETKLNSYSYGQTDLRKFYNSNNGNKKDIPSSGGICWASAMTSLLKYNKLLKKM